MAETTKKLTPRERKKADKRAARTAARASGANPRWFVPVMVGLMLIGLVWVVTYYLTQARFPVEAWGNWNLGAGFGFIVAGFLMTTRWR
ncbi:cell division protein CrgA [Agilicoccus flavus]|uniref:cell division protein CrgA n=1 Tax=Agilicoccus flavus TaxID=2775968 RepID=UPI001CF6857F|nr:cell division protein CrgA [Agilicoccus flavus]